MQKFKENDKKDELSFNWLNNITVEKDHNCLNGDSCPFNSECCYERDTVNGVKGNHGVCVLKGKCNFKTGFPTGRSSGIEGFFDDKNLKKLYFLGFVFFFSLTLYNIIKMKK